MGNRLNYNMNISPENLEKLKAANLSNIVKKVKEGKILTAYEQRQLAAATKEETHLVSQLKICEIFNITRKTIAQWRREKKKGVPQKEGTQENLEKWREFFASNPDAGFFDGKPRADRETLLCQKLEVEVAIKKIELQQAEGSVVDLNDAKDAFTKIGSVVRAILLRLRADMPPTLEGLSVAAMAKKFDEFTVKVLQEISDSQNEIWNNEQEE